MNTFFVDNLLVTTYNDLLNRVNGADSYIEIFKTENLFNYFCNFTIALCNNLPLQLIDTDTKVNEIKGMSESEINAAKRINGKVLNSIEELIYAMLNSKSKITIFTSGTTGQPKKVVHTVETLTRQTRISESYKECVWAFAYNPTHMAGLQVFFQALSNTNTIVNVFNKSRSEVLTLIREYNISHISATPTFYRLLLPVSETYPSVQRVTLGGEKSENNLYDAIRRIFPNARLNNIYASTEAGSLFVAKGENFQIPDSLKDRFKVVDDELLIHKSLLGESDSFVIHDNYYHSGDVIEWIDQEAGIFKFKSRKNELINVGGYKVNPNEVEEALLTIAGIRQAVVYGRTNSVLGNILCAEVRLDDITLSELQIRERLSSMLQDYKVPRQIKFVNEFELTRTGKIKRK